MNIHFTLVFVYIKFLVKVIHQFHIDEYQDDKDVNGSLLCEPTRMEQSPNPDSRVSLYGEKDALGVPKARLNWDLTDLDKRSMRKIYEIIGEQVGMADVGRIKLYDFLRDENDMSWPATTGGGWHHMGTTKMHNDPKRGVVDENCKVHGISNLFVAGSSCFSTAAAPNPTHSLVALSLRLSDHVKTII